MTTDVFISYSRKDKEFAQKLNTALAARDRDAWVDWEGIPLTVDWWAEIEAGIEAANTFIFIISPDSAASEVCNKEIDYAAKNHKRIVPIVYRDTNDVPHSLGHLNWVFLRDTDDFDSAFDGLMAALDTDYEWVKSHTRLLQRAVDWDKKERNESLLLRGDDLDNADEMQVYTEKDPQLSELQGQYILVSHQRAMAEAEQRVLDQEKLADTQRQRAWVLATGLVVAVILGIVAFSFWGQANSNLDQANIAGTQSAENAATAVSAEAMANSERDIAATAQVNAENSEAEAVTQRDAAAAAQAEAEEAQVAAEEAQIAAEEAQAEAERQAEIASVGKLSALSISQHDKQLDLALLLSLEAYNTMELNQSKNAIYEGWANNPTLVQFLHGHTGFVECVAWSNDGFLASGSIDSTVIVWDPETQQPIHVLEGHEDEVTSVAWSQDGQLASSSREGEIIIWNLDTGEPAQNLFGHEDDVVVVAWSADGQLASGSGDMSIIIWDLETGQPAQTLLGHEGEISDIAWSSNGQLASSSYDGEVFFWDPATGRMTQSTFGPDGAVSLDWSDDGRLLAIGGEYNSVSVWDPAAGKLVSSILRAKPGVDHPDFVKGVAWIDDGRLAFTSQDGIVHIWRLETARELQTLEGFGALTDIAWSEDGLLASSSKNNAVLLWNVNKYQAAQDISDLDGAWVMDVAVSADGQMASSSISGALYVQEVSSIHENFHELIGHSDVAQSMAWSPTGQLASGGRDAQVIVWDLVTNEPAQVLSGHGAWVRSVAWSDAGQLASGSDEGLIIVWDLETGQEKQRIYREDLPDITELVWIGENSLVSSTQFGEIMFWNLSTGEAEKSYDPRSPVMSLALSDDGRFLAGGTLFGNVMVWDLETDQLIQLLSGHTDMVSGVAWSTDGQLVSGSYDTTLTLWDLTSGDAVITLSGHTGLITSVDWSEGWLVSGEAGGRILLWEMNPDTWQKESCQRAGRNLTQVEWDQYFPDETYRTTCSQWLAGE